MYKNRLAAFGLAAGLLGGGIAGIAFGAPGFAGAQTADSTTTESSAAPARGQWMTDALASLVANGTINQAQADAVRAALDEARPAHDHRGGPGRGGPGNLEAAAGALNMTVDELRAALQGGQNLAEVAQSKGVDPEAVVSALVADKQARIAEKVAAGDITQAEADEKLASLTERIRALRRPAARSAARVLVGEMPAIAGKKPTESGRSNG